MSSLRKFLLLPLALPLFLCACGFEPLYQEQDGKGAYASQALPAIEIAIIPNEEGVFLRNELLDIFTPPTGSLNPYKLSVSELEVNLTELDITQSSDATRGQLRISTAFTFFDPKGDRVLIRDVSSIASYNILESEFTNRVSKENARRNAIIKLAEQIERQILLYFQRIGKP